MSACTCSERQESKTGRSRLVTILQGSIYARQDWVLRLDKAYWNRVVMEIKGQQCFRVHTSLSKTNILVVQLKGKMEASHLCYTFQCNNNNNSNIHTFNLTLLPLQTIFTNAAALEFGTHQRIKKCLMYRQPANPVSSNVDLEEKKRASPHNPGW